MVEYKQRRQAMIIKGNSIYFEDGICSGYLIVEDGILKQSLSVEADIQPDGDYKDKMLFVRCMKTHKEC